MSEIKDKPNRRALLKDLEHIRESLSDDEFNDDDIPILTDSVGEESDAEADEVEASEEDEVFFDEKRIFDDYEEFEDEDLIADADDDDDEGFSEDSEEDLVRAAYRDTLEQEGRRSSRASAAEILEGQQSLFDAEEEFTLTDLNETGIRPSIELPPEDEPHVLPAAFGENPFLPKHIRERLTQGKNSFLEEIALVNESLKKPPTSREKKTEDKPEILAPAAKSVHQRIVDEVLAEYLPQIEAALRKRLTQVLQEKDK